MSEAAFTIQLLIPCVFAAASTPTKMVVTDGGLKERSFLVAKASSYT